MTSKAIKLLLLSVIILVTGGLWVGNRDEISQPSVLMVKTNIDDDPMKGSKNAPVTIVEFSDYECPYCKQFATETLPQLQSRYIDMNKVRFVYRDLPLISHEPAATSEARSANCAREQSGDVGYFRFHDRIFQTTKSGGSGVTIDQLIEMAKLIELDTKQFEACYRSDRYGDEVKADYDEAQRIGAKVTPSFVIGKTQENGEVEGVMIEGSAPFSLLQTIIDPLLYEQNK